MVETIGLTTRSGLTFTADVAGPAGGPLVLLLHGFPESRHSWRAALPVLGAAGYRCVAPDQRGYSAGARPDPADLSNYAFDKLVNDAIEIAAAAGYEGKRFHQVGHDWGGQVSWGVANAHPERLASLTVLSRPHPLSFRRALQDPNGDQKHRSRHHTRFLEPETGPMLIEDNARRLREGLFGQNVGQGAIADHVAVLGNPLGDRGGAGLVSLEQGPVGRLRPDQGADALHLGRCRRDRRARRGQGHGRVRDRGLCDGSAAGRRPLRDGQRAGQGDRADAGAPAAPSRRELGPFLPLRRNRATTRRLQILENFAWLARRSR